MVLYFLSAKNQNRKAGHEEKDLVARMFTCYFCGFFHFCFSPWEGQHQELTFSYPNLTANDPVWVSGKWNTCAVFLQQCFQRSWEIPNWICRIKSDLLPLCLNTSGIKAYGCLPDIPFQSLNLHVFLNLSSSFSSSSWDICSLESSLSVIAGEMLYFVIVQTCCCVA